MADTKISALTELAAGPAVDDVVPLVDVSDTSMAASGTDKKIKAARLSPIIVRRSTDTAAVNSGNTGSTLTNDDTLLWAVLANEVWFFEGWIIYTAANTTMDIKFGWSTTATGTTMQWGGMASAGATAPGGYGLIAVGSTPAAMLGIAGTVSLGSGSGTFGVGLAGVVTVSSTAGNVNLQFAQDVANASDLKLKANSFLRLTRLA